MLWLLVIVSILFVLARILRTRLEHPLTKALLLPGALLGLSARLLACWLSGTRLEAIHLWRRGPLLEHERPNPLGRLLLALLPPAVAAAAILVARHHLAAGLTLDLALPPLEPSLEQTALVIETSRRLLAAFASAITSLPSAFSPPLLALLWLSVAALLYAAPRYEEWTIELALGLGAWLLAAVAASWGIGPRFLSRAWLARWLYGDTIREALGLLLALTLATAALSLALLAAVSLLRALLRPRRRQER